MNIWFISLVLMIPLIIWSGIDNIPYERFERNLSRNETIDFEIRSTCIIIWPENRYFHADIAFIIYSIIVSFAIPTCVITVLYVLIIKALRKSERFRRKSSMSGNQLNKPRRKVTKRVLILISVIVICYTPYWINQIVLLIYYTLDTYQTKLFHYISSCLSIIFQILIFFNSALNPYLYGLFSKKFKTQNLLRCNFLKFISSSSLRTGLWKNKNKVLTRRYNKRNNKRSPLRRSKV